MKETNLPEIIENKPIECLIYEVRGMPVMLDSDIAILFGEKTERVNQQMKRNINRFPDDFCFKLNSNEFKILTLQNAISKKFSIWPKPTKLEMKHILAISKK